ncbi:MAG: nucleotidyltransferase family protein [Terrimicrobiaceae bacterium]
MVAMANPEKAELIQKNSDEVLAVVHEIASKFSPDRVILFGSRAHGTATRDSDADFLVVMDHDSHPALKAAEIRRAIHAPFGMDLIVRSKTKIEERLNMADPFFSEIFSSGITLYESTGP